VGLSIYFWLPIAELALSAAKMNAANKTSSLMQGDHTQEQME